MPKRGKDMSKKIGSQIQTFLTKNVGLKLIAIVSASLLWLLVVNLDDPTQSRNFTATVTVENEDVLTDAGIAEWEHCDIPRHGPAVDHREFVRQ